MIDNIVVNKIVVSNTISLGKNDFKYFKKIRPLRIFLQKKNAYRRGIDKTRCMSFLIKDKLKVYDKKINTDFHDNKMPKKSSECIWLSVILLDFVYKKDKKYCSQVFLE